MDDSFSYEKKVKKGKGEKKKGQLLGQDSPGAISPTLPRVQ